METYPQQHEPWQPANPPVWNVMFSGRPIDTCKPYNSSTLDRNVQAFATTRQLIMRIMDL